ncbi:ankyrin domain-containing protein [Naegleria gruberi]|uniref:Ankyrin domain-containing protein n=1 Tax=Naegleria gruberi TaxID=5762 RepID=D2VJW4_NAEGR|nr:ankyrin domain-containing protein [Naegleria gruberi]EFC42840.1 ankyrin domain-containing protein [Naegleria gruberi]|eukprot:XP_002675584.1 ankyrin domain-containing protein [Naegleria gruberi strain NEG-M]
MSTSNALQTALEFKEEGNQLLKIGTNLPQVISLYTKGLKTLKKATQVDSDQKNKILVDLYNNRSHVYYLMGSFYNAVPDAQNSLEIDKENVKSLLRLVRAAIRVNEYSKVIENCEKAELLLMGNSTDSSILTKNVEIFREFKEKAQIGKENHEKFMKVFQLLEEKDNAQVREILDTFNEDISLVCDHHGESFLHYASRSGNFEMVKYLLEEKKIFIDMQNYRSASPLYYAAYSGFPEIVEYLMEMRADPTHASSFSGRKPHEVCSSGEMKGKLTQYFTKFESIKKDPFYNFKYRMGEYWRQNLFYFRHPNAEGYFQGLQVFPKAREIVVNSDIQELLKVVIEKRSEYDSFFTDDRKNQAHDECLLCNEIVENCAKCKFCRMVNLCTKCENSSDQSITVMKTIHQNNCKSGMYF